MKTKAHVRLLTLLVLTLAFSLQPSALLQAAPLGTAFTYQGQLTDRGTPVNGVYDLRFALFDDASGGAQWSQVVTNAGVAVNNGLFTTPVDFGASPFDGTARWLEIGVRTNGGGGFTSLVPRQPLAPTPYALFATNAGLAVNATTALGVAPNAVTVAGIANSNITSAKIAGGQVVRSLNQLKDDVLLGAGTNITMAVNGNIITVSSPTWGLTGNGNTTPGLSFLGTTDNQPLELKVNGQRALRLEPANITGEAPNLIGGYYLNSVSPGVVGATIAGGGAYLNAQNEVTDDHGTVSGGVQNQAGDGLGTHSDAGGATVAGGAANTASATCASVGGGLFNSAKSKYALVGGGRENVASNDYATVVGGQQNLAGGDHATIGGGLTNTANGYLATIGGGSANTASGHGAFVGGGDLNAATNTHTTIGGGNQNKAWGDAATVAGGNVNRASGDFAAIGGGEQNRIESYASHATIGGGSANYLSANYTTIGGGANNAVGVGLGDYATIGGGNANISYAYYSTIGGGEGNWIGSSSWWATIGGGSTNYIPSNAHYSTVGGGLWNTILLGGDCATIPGGRENAATNYAFAAGRRAKANHTGAFVWADAIDADFVSTTPNQFNVRATGGVRVDTAAAPGISLNAADRSLLTCGWNPFTSGTHSGVGRWGMFMEAHTLVLGMPALGGKTIQMVKYNEDSTLSSLALFDQSGNLTIAGTLVELSDRDAKDNFAPVDSREVLEKVTALPISRWNFKQEAGVPHLGPMAQDFHAAFGLGTDDKHIATVDADGVALAAIQGLNQKLKEEMKRRDAENAELKQEVAELKRLVNQLSVKLSGGAM